VARSNSTCMILRGEQAQGRWDFYLRTSGSRNHSYSWRLAFRL